MTIRHAFYTTYNGNEYRVVNRDGFARLISNDIRDLENGFVESEPDRGLRYFIKMVSPLKIGEVYEINTFCLYHGFEFHISYEENGEYVLVSDYSPLVEKLGFSRIDKYGYEKVVRKEDLDLIYEKKTLVTDFFD